MNHPHAHEIENTKVRVRCPDCRTNFHERLSRVIHHVEQHTCRPHFSLGC